MKEDRRERLPPSKQNCRGERGALKKNSQRRELYVVRWQVVLLLLCCRALLSLGGEGVVGEAGGGRFLFLSVLFFPSGGSSHGRTGSDLCLGRATYSSSSRFSFSQLEWTRAVHVTSHLERGAGPGFNRSLNFRLNYLWGHTYPSCHTSRGAAGCVVFPDRYNHNYFCKKNKNQTRSRKYVN